MSSVASIAASSAVASQAQLQSTLATIFTKSNADADRSIVALIEAAAANLESVTKSATAPGVGANLDISA